LYLGIALSKTGNFNLAKKENCRIGYLGHAWSFETRKNAQFIRSLSIRLIRQNGKNLFYCTDAKNRVMEIAKLLSEYTKYFVNFCYIWTLSHPLNLLMVNNHNFPMLLIIYHSSCLTHNARTLYVWLFNESGYTYIWDTHTFSNAVWLRLNIKQKLQDRYIQSWLSEIENSGKALNYRLSKRQFESENYLYSLGDNFLY